MKAIAATWQMVSHYLNHPLGRLDRIGTLSRIITWQLASRLLSSPVAMPFVDDLRLLLEKGMHGATGNAYVGLMEFSDMAFVAHLLRCGDSFVDIGANVGAYSLLAASRGAQVLAFEPLPDAYEALLDNANLNRFQSSIDARNVGVGVERGALQFSTAGGPTNHVIAAGESTQGAITVSVDSLDALTGLNSASMIKIDVEGFEASVIRGGAKTLSSPSLLAVLIELNGLGVRYGFRDSDIHAELLSLGFSSVAYDPFRRCIKPLEQYNRTGNTLYVRPSSEIETRLKDADPIIWQNLSI